MTGLQIGARNLTIEQVRELPAVRGPLPGLGWEASAEITIRVDCVRIMAGVQNRTLVYTIRVGP